MNKIKSIILDQTNWLEVTWVKVETITLPKEVVEGVADTVLRTQEVETIIRCESFGDSDEYQELLRQRCIEFGTEVTEELNSKLKEQISKIHIPTEEEIEAKRLADEEQRVLQIKSKAEELITAKYSIIWQLNHPRLDETYKDDYAYIDRIRDISNEAEANGTTLEDIDWGV